MHAETCSSLKEIKDAKILGLIQVAIQVPFDPSAANKTGDSNGGSFPGTLPVGFGRYGCII
jgi:hypothetical protein